MSQYSWIEFAACRGDDTNRYFPELGTPAALIREAKAVCAQCPVKLECLELGLEKGNWEHGIFGGTSPGQRRVIRAQRAAGVDVVLSETSGVSDNESEETLGLDDETETSMEGILSVSRSGMETWGDVSLA